VGTPFVLEVADWAALISTDPVEQIGAAEGPETIPAQMRRRLPPFAREVARCALPILRADPASVVVFASPHGDLVSAATLLSDLARKELLSPALFSLSVHNAPAGVLSLCVTERGDHTAIAGDAATLPAALIECYARLAESGSDALTLVYADQKFPEVYAHLEEDAPGVVLALRLRRASGAAAAQAMIRAGRASAVAAARALVGGARHLTFDPAAEEAMAA
jgi:hypothetical protein